MSFKVSIDGFSLKYELTNFSLTLLLSLLPFFLILLFTFFVPLHLVSYGLSSLALVVFGIWILEVVGAVFVPAKLDKVLTPPKENSITIVVSAYLRHEKDIIVETILH